MNIIPSSSSTGAVKQILDVVRTFLKSWNHYDIPFVSAGLTYYTVLAFVPLVSLLLTISTIFINKQFVASELISYANNLFTPEIANRLETIILDLVGADYSLALSVGGLVALLYAASSYFARLNQKVHLIITAQEDFGIKDSLKRRGVALLYSVMIFIIIALVSLTQWFLIRIGDIFASDGLERLFDYVIDPLAVLLSILFLGLLLSTFYRTLTVKVRKFRYLLLSGVIVSSALYITNGGLGLALRYSATYQDYGIFSALVSVVIWAFTINAIILSGAIVIKDFVPIYQAD